MAKQIKVPDPVDAVEKTFATQDVFGGNLILEARQVPDWEVLPRNVSNLTLLWGHCVAAVPLGWDN